MRLFLAVISASVCIALVHYIVAPILAVPMNWVMTLLVDYVCALFVAGTMRIEEKPHWRPMDYILSGATALCTVTFLVLAITSLGSLAELTVPTILTGLLSSFIAGGLAGLGFRTIAGARN